MSIEKEKSATSYPVSWPVSPTHNVPISCSLVSGLSALVQMRIVELETSLLRGNPGLEHVMRLDVERCASGEKRSIGIEFFDRNDIFCRDTLEEVDVYFKRNYSSAPVYDLPNRFQTKIRRGGLTFGCVEHGTRRLMAKSALMAFIGRTKRRESYRLYGSFKQFAKDIEQIRCFLESSDWERNEQDYAQQRVVFQTRVWRQPLQPEVDRDDVNDSRIALTRALLSEFGPISTIGILDTPCARELAPDAISAKKISRKQYARQLRTSLIAVNSHGLDGSLGFKVAESLAAGCALVSEPFAVELPEPLVAGKHYLAYETPEECVEKCRYLLENPDVAAKMRATNLAYFRHNVAPASIAKNLIESAFEPADLCAGEQIGVDKTAGSLA